MVYFLTVGIATIGLFIWFMKCQFKHWENLGVFNIKPNFIFGKNNLFLADDSRQFYFTIYNKIKPHRVGGFFCFLNPLLMVTDAEIVKKIVGVDAGHFMSTDKRPWSWHTNENAERIRKRVLLSQYFTVNRLDSLLNVMSGNLSILYSVVEKKANLKGDIELKSTLAPVINLLLQSSIRMEHSASDKKHITGNDSQQWITSFKYFKSLPIIKYFIQNQYGIPGKSKLTSNQIKITKDKSVPYEVTSELQKWTWAITHTLCYALYELSINREAQEELRNEIQRQMSLNDGKLTLKVSRSMIYLNAVIQETLRKHPPVEVLMREVGQEYAIPEVNVVLKKGARVVIPVQALHLDPANFPEPESFRPERFLTGNLLPASYMPFGKGTSCIVQDLAETILKVVLCKVLTKYELEASEQSRPGIWIQTRLLTNPKSYISPLYESRKREPLRYY